MKHFALIVTYANGKKGVFLTDNADLPSALIEFKNAQIKSMTDIIDKSYTIIPEIISAELAKIVNFSLT